MITSKEIKHDKNKKQLVYKDAVLKVYNVPVLYFPKFFHPDPTVDRQSGFLKPSLVLKNQIAYQQLDLGEKTLENIIQEHCKL